LGEPHTAGEILQSVTGPEQLRNSLDRMIAHLRSNEVDVDKPLITVGAALEMDSAKETFTNNSLANQLLRRTQRRPFEIPELA
jgi:hypothetical protein